MGGTAIENRWGIGELPTDDTELYVPEIPTDTYLDFVERRTKAKSVFGAAAIG